MEQELKEVDGVAGVASETSLSISPSPSFFSFFFFGLLIFATLSTCRRRRNSWRYQRPTQKKKKELFFCLLRLINSAELIRCQSCWDFGRFVRRIFGEKTTKKRKREKKKREQMTRMAVSCRARLYGYFRSKQPCGRVNGRSTWWTILTQHGQTPFHNEIVGGEQQHRSTEYSLVVHDFAKFRAYTSEKQNLSCCFFLPPPPSHSLYRGRQQTLGQWTFSVRVSKCVLIWRGVEAREEKKIAVIAVDVIPHSDGQRKATRRLCGCEKKRRIVVYRVRFHFSLLPLFCLPFDLFYIDFFVTGLCVCVLLLLGRSQLKSKDLRESDPWAAGRLARHPSITGSRAGSTRRPEIAPLWFSFFSFLPFSSFSSSLYAILGWFSFHSFKTQHATIIQHSSTVGASLFGFAATSESREKDDGGLLGESLRATGESGRAWESSRLGESVTAIVVIQKRKTLKSGGRQRETQRMVTLVSPWDRQRGGNQEEEEEGLTGHDNLGR